METQEITKKTIKLDIDGRYDLKRLEISLKMLRRHWKLHFIVGSVWKTQNGWHIYLTVKTPLFPPTVVLIQSLMGSDYKREILNIERLITGSHGNDWNILFHEKEVFDARKTRRLNLVITRQ